jgi:hypothetical protein
MIEGIIPTLRKDENNIFLRCKSPSGINPRLQVTVISEGKPLGK